MRNNAKDGIETEKLMMILFQRLCTLLRNWNFVSRIKRRIKTLTNMAEPQASKIDMIIFILFQVHEK